MRKKTLSGLVGAAAAMAMMFVALPQASAAYMTEVVTSDDPRRPGGEFKFYDYGPGRPGGGNNDDYFRVWDRRADGHGVKAWLWVDGQYLESKYNGRGKGKSVLWDPKQMDGANNIGLKVCLVDGKNGYPKFCQTTNFVHAEYV